ncbi:MAG TPA: NAD(P)-dependent oxidoreductase [Allosphingosinicella sp.]|jgi:nucleoside-diphosphate-sugar epimerase
MRILVTGAAGLIGGAVAARLRGEHDVTGLDLCPGPEVALLHDIRTPLRLDGYSAVVHVAALHAPQVGRASETEFRAVNVDATACLLESSIAAGVARFVYTSSTSVYGHALEPASGRAAWIDEEVEPEPGDIYDETKLEAEALVRASGLTSTILRMSRCFPEPLRDMALHRLHRGIDRRDVAEAHALALAGAADGCDTYVVARSRRSPETSAKSSAAMHRARYAAGRPHLPPSSTAVAGRSRLRSAASTCRARPPRSSASRRATAPPASSPAIATPRRSSDLPRSHKPCLSASAGA